jgi:hypothetical protein
MKPTYGAIFLLVLAVVSASALSGAKRSKRETGENPCSDLTSCLGPVTVSFEGTSCEGEASYYSFLRNASDIGECLLESQPTTYTCQADFLNITRWNEDTCSTMSISTIERIGVCVADLTQNTSYVQLCHVNDTFTRGFPGYPILNPQYTVGSSDPCNSTTGECSEGTIMEYTVWEDVTTCNPANTSTKVGVGANQNISLGGCVYESAQEYNLQYGCTDTHIFVKHFSSGCDGAPYLVSTVPLGKCLLSGDSSALYTCNMPPSEPVAEEPTSTPSSSEPSSPEASPQEEPSNPISIPTSTTPVDAPSSASLVEKNLLVAIASIAAFSLLLL